MPLKKDDPFVLSTKSLITTYDMPIFAVDLIKETYNTNDPFLIAKLLAELFDIDDLSIEKIIKLMQLDNKPLTGDFSICTRDIF